MLLRRYFLKRTLIAFLAVFSILSLVFVVNSGVDYLGDAAAGKLAPQHIAGIVGLKMLVSLKITVPLCLFLALLMTMNTMTRDRELVAISSAGLGARFYIRAAMEIGTVMMVMVAMVSFIFEPWADLTVHRLQSVSKQEAEIFGISPGQFKEFSSGDRVMFAAEVSENNRNLQTVFLRVRGQGDDGEGVEGVLAAEQAHIEDNAELRGRFVVFEDGRRYDGRAGDADYAVTQFETYGVKIDQDNTEDEALLQNVSMMPTLQLLRRSGPHAAAEMHWRVAMPIATLLLAILAVVLARVRLLQGAYLPVLAGLMVYFTYSNTLGIAKGLAKQGALSPEIGLWPVHICFIAFIFLVERYQKLGA